MQSRHRNFSRFRRIASSSWERRSSFKRTKSNEVGSETTFLRNRTRRKSSLTLLGSYLVLAIRPLRRRHLPTHCLNCLALDLANPFGGDAVFVGELLQRRRILFLQPARLDDATASVIELGHRALQADAAIACGLRTLEYLNRLVLRVRQVCDGCHRRLFIAGRGVERDVTAPQTHFHFKHFFGLDAKLARDVIGLLTRQRAHSA